LPNAVACWYVANAPLHFGSWFQTAAWCRTGPPVRLRGPFAAAAAINGRMPLMGTKFLAAAAKTTTIAATTTTAKSSDYLPFLIIIVLFALFYMLILRPQRNRQRQAQQRQNTVMPGSRIRTTAGIYGTVVSADDRDIVVEVAPGVKIKMLRRAVMDVVPDDDPSVNGSTGTDTGQENQTWDGQDAADDRDTKDQNI
jgi:preprotein translocase subunit YajC